MSPDMPNKLFSQRAAPAAILPIDTSAVRKVNCQSSTLTHLQMEDGVTLKPDKFDSLLAAEMSNLSCADRNLVEEEIHGARCLAVNETPELVKQSIERFECALLEIAVSEIKKGHSSMSTTTSRSKFNDSNEYDSTTRTPIVPSKSEAPSTTRVESPISMSSSSSTPKRFFLTAQSGSGATVLEAIRSSMEDNYQSLSSPGRGGSDIYNSSSSSCRPPPQRHYIRTLKFQLMFLRSEFFHVEKAARRCWNYLNKLVQFYGPQTLTRPLMLSDLPEDCIDLMKRGRVQLSPLRDRAGRLVLFSRGTMPDVSHLCRYQMYFYLLSAAAEDIEVQKRGLVMIFSFHKLPPSQLLFDHEYHVGRTEYHDTIPLRACSMYLCAPTKPLFDVLRTLFYLGWRHEDRVRTRSLAELSSMETQYQLSTMGVNVQELPESSGGTIKTKNHLQWMKTRRYIDAARQLYRDQQKEWCTRQQQQQCHPNYHTVQQPTTLQPPTPVSVFDTFGCIAHPGVDDVIYSQGGKQKNWGNRDYQYSVASRVEAYYNTNDRKVRRNLRTEVIEQIRSSNGRFLGRVDRSSMNKCVGGSSALLVNGDFFVEVTDVEDIHQRISKSLYEHHRNQRAQKNLQRIESGTTKFSGLVDANHKRRKVIDDDGNVATPLSTSTCGGCL